MAKAMWAGAIGALIALGVAFHEWTYHGDHPHRPGPSAEIAALGLAVIAIGVAVAYIAYTLDNPPGAQKIKWTARADSEDEE